MAAASATDAAIHKEMFGSGFRTLIILNGEKENIIKILKSLENFAFSKKVLVKHLKMKKKNKKEHFLQCY